MRQALSDKISTAILDYRAGETRLLLQKQVGITQTDKSILVEILRKEIQEVASMQIQGSHLGCRICVVVSNRMTLLTKQINWAGEAIKEALFERLDAIDYYEIIRVKADTLEDECIAIEIVEITPKREAWI